MIRQSTLFLRNYLEAAQTVNVHYLRHVPVQAHQTIVCSNLIPVHLEGLCRHFYFVSDV